MRWRKHIYPGIMEHLERAGVPQVTVFPYPPQNLSFKSKEIINYTEKLAKALE